MNTGPVVGVGISVDMRDQIDQIDQIDSPPPGVSAAPSDVRPLP